MPFPPIDIPLLPQIQPHIHTTITNDPNTFPILANDLNEDILLQIRISNNLHSPLPSSTQTHEVITWKPFTTWLFISLVVTPPQSHAKEAQLLHPPTLLTDFYISLSTPFTLYSSRINRFMNLKYDYTPILLTIPPKQPDHTRYQPTSTKKNLRSLFHIGPQPHNFTTQSMEFNHFKVLDMVHIVHWTLTNFYHCILGITPNSYSKL